MMFNTNRLWRWINLLVPVLAMTAVAAPAAEPPVRILVLGDSLTSGYGLAANLMVGGEWEKKQLMMVQIGLWLTKEVEETTH